MTPKPMKPMGRWTLEEFVAAQVEAAKAVRKIDTLNISQPLIGPGSGSKTSVVAKQREKMDALLAAQAESEEYLRSLARHAFEFEYQGRVPQQKFNRADPGTQRFWLAMATALVNRIVADGRYKDLAMGPGVVDRSEANPADVEKRVTRGEG
ncbi:hypothetical protein [Rhodococcus qingshengii]|uniref:hypothetical protein n=1 Tax=Rhodococcus qingshengii TaxID=334542 RepID=UPI001ADF9DC2|nr:hypothetical protein [Rhodococcus qingshengii]MCQ4150257.1 hypothetical protein [Rhodococcus qingshengii]